MRIKRALMFWILWWGLFYPLSFAIGSPVEVVFSPKGAIVKEVTKVRVEKKDGQIWAAIYLPPGADPKHLRIEVVKNRPRLYDYTVHPASIPFTEQGRAREKRLEELKKNQGALVATLRALESQILFWQSQAKGRVKNMIDATNTASYVGKNLKKLIGEKYAVEAELGKLEAEITRLEKEGKKENGWEVIVYLENDPGRELTLIYSYPLTGSAWSPFYRLEALPGKGEILFYWYGEIAQQTGQDWYNVSIRLIFPHREPTEALPALSSWVFRPSNSSKDNRAEEVHLDWAVGSTHLPTHKKIRVKIVEERWPAVFSYLSRPRAVEGAFLQGEVKFPAHREMPPGPAVFLIDGVTTAKKTFAFSGKEGNFLFGSDPLVNVFSHLLSNEAMLAEAPSQEWLIKASNKRPHRIELRVEEPIPKSQDNQIKVSPSYNPPPTYRTEDLATWHLTLSPGEDKTIHTKVELRKPNISGR